MGNIPGRDMTPRTIRLDEERVFIDFSREDPSNGSEFNYHCAYVSQYIYNWSKTRIDEDTVTPWVCTTIF